MIKIRVNFLGAKPDGFQIGRIQKWKSELFSIDKFVGEYILDVNSDLDNYGYSDANLGRYIDILAKPAQGVDIYFYVLDVPIERNYISRVIRNNRILVSYNGVKAYLQEKSIPIENMLLMLFYSYVLLYRSHVGSDLSALEEEMMNHEPRRGCLYDYCGELQDIAYSCIKPDICEKCEETLCRKGMQLEVINIARKELKHIDRTLYQKVFLWAKSHPLLTWIAGAIATILLGILIPIMFGHQSV